MTHDEAFIQAIRESPDDDAPRLIYADWLMEQADPVRAERGEFIQLQCKLARMPFEHPDRPALKAREETLHSRNRKAWRAPLWRLIENDPKAAGYFMINRKSAAFFRRGFLDDLSISAPAFLTCAEELIRLTPLDQLSLMQGGSHASELAACPYLKHIRSLSFNDYYGDPVDNTSAAHLSRAMNLGRLRRLSLYMNNVSDSGVEALVEAPWWGQLAECFLGENALTARGVSALIRGASRQRLLFLDVGGNLGGNWDVDGLPSANLFGSLLHLRLHDCHLGLPGLTVVLSASSAERLACLDLSDNPEIGEAGAVMIAASNFKQLTNLILSKCHLGDAGVEALALSPVLGKIRDLDLSSNELSDRAAHALARSPYLIHLKHLLLKENRITNGGQDALRRSPYFQPDFMLWLSDQPPLSRA